MATMIDVSEGRAVLANAGYIGRVSVVGGSLIAYSGDEMDPATWMECDRFVIRDGKVSATAIHAFVGE